MKKLIIVGSGPTSMCAAVKLIDDGYTNIKILEKGIFRPNEPGVDVTSGYGGSGSFSDSKINLTHKVGGTMHELLGHMRFYEYLEEQKQIWLRFAPTDVQKAQRLEHNPKADLVSREFVPSESSSQLRTKALAHNMDLDVYTILHLGTDNAYDICNNIYDYLISKGVDIQLETTVETVHRKDGGYFEVITDKGNFETENVLVAPGRSGGHLVKRVATDNGITLENNGIDIGVRVELPQELGDSLYAMGVYEPKFWKYAGKSQVKTRSFCYCPQNAFVAKEEYRDTGIATVNGHSYSADGASSGNLNFAVLATTTFTYPFHDPLAYAEATCRKVNLLAGGNVMVQRFGDLKAGRRSTTKRLLQGATRPSLDAEPGALDLAFPYRQLDAIVDFLDTLGQVVTGFNSDHALLYAPEVKFYSNKVPVDADSMTAIPGLYVGGDGSGWTRGLNQAAIQGLVVADALLKEPK